MFVELSKVIYTVNGTAVPFVYAGAVWSTATDVSPDRFSKKDLSNGYLITLAVSTQ